MKARHDDVPAAVDGQDSQETPSGQPETGGPDTEGEIRRDAKKPWFHEGDEYPVPASEEAPGSPKLDIHDFAFSEVALVASEVAPGYPKPASITGAQKPGMCYKEIPPDEF